LVSVEASLNVLFKEVFSTFTNYLFTPVPLFVLMGFISFYSGAGRRLYDAAHKWLGHLPGGLAMATIGGCAAFSAICGVTFAAAATMGVIALPEMKKYNYHSGLATASVAAGGTLGILIPPSITLMVYGIITEQSIGILFIAGIVPGILLSILFIFSIYIRARIDPRLGPRARKISLKDKLSAIAGVSETAVLFTVVMGGLFVGWFTPTEAGAVGVAGSVILSLIRRTLGYRNVLDSLMETIKMTAMLFTIVVGALIFSRFLAVTGLPTDLASWCSSLELSPHLMLVFILCIYIIGGCIMDSLSFILLTIPIFFPLLINAGFDPIWFGVVIVVVSEMGLITPPVGINVFVLASVAKDVPLEVIFKGIVPFFAVLLLFLIILIVFPQIALFLPDLMR
jgi:tripartite ATP-independent transporter DctM subunit